MPIGLNEHNRVLISEDPIGFEGGDYNLFRIVGNNPMNFIDPLGLADDPLIYGTPGTPQNPMAPNVGKLIEIVNGFGKFFLGISAMNQADDAILEKQKTIKYGKSQDILILYGTMPIRFVGLAKPGDDLLLNTDVKAFPTTIDGLQGLNTVPSRKCP